MQFTQPLSSTGKTLYLETRDKERPSNIQVRKFAEPIMTTTSVGDPVKQIAATKKRDHSSSESVCKYAKMFFDTKATNAPLEENISFQRTKKRPKQGYDSLSSEENSDDEKAECGILKRAKTHNPLTEATPLCNSSFEVSQPFITTDSQLSTPSQTPPRNSPIKIPSSAQSTKSQESSVALNWEDFGINSGDEEDQYQPYRAGIIPFDSTDDIDHRTSLALIEDSPTEEN